MKITKTSMITGKENTREINITQGELDRWNSPRGRPIQNEFPHLDSNDREFLITGTTPEEWDMGMSERKERDAFEESIDKEGAANDD